MGRHKNQKGALTIEASISYSIFLMVIVTVLYIMRIVYVYGLMQHAVTQTAKELSMYSYLYQVLGVDDLSNQIEDATSTRTEQLNSDIEEVVNFYETFSSGDYTNLSYDGTMNLSDWLKNFGSAMLSEANSEVQQQLFEAIALPLIEGYIGADSSGSSADERLKKLYVVDGLSGLNLDSSSFFEDGTTIDLVVCYTLDPIFPINIMPEMNLVNRAYVQGIEGESIFK